MDEGHSMKKSRSFNTIFFHKYASQRRNTSSSKTKYNYLGQNDKASSYYQPHSPNNGGGGGSTNPKGFPPNPIKTMNIINTIQVGLKACIQSMKDDLQLCTGEEYKQQHIQLKTLEYQQSWLNNLKEQYEIQQKLRDGVRNMAYAYTLSHGKEKDHALASVKAGFKECTDVLGTLESQVQQYLGGFHLKMKGITGFARLCPGDTYEITIKHGTQKWKTRVKTGKDGLQTWDVPEMNITALLCEDLFIKAAEVKTLGKQVLLGNKFCEIGELFAPHPQVMTVNLNSSGSLKLSIIVEWNPLAQFYHHDMKSTPRKKFSNNPSLLRNNDFSFRSSSMQPRNVSNRKQQENLNRQHHDQQQFHRTVRKAVLDPEVIEDLKDSILKLAGILNDEIQGQYPELEVCEVNVAALRKIIFKDGHESEKYKSTGNLSIESALECFDFLDSCDSTSSLPGVVRKSSQRQHSKKTSDGTEYDTKTTTDSGISSLNSRSPSPHMTSVTGRENLDLALFTHIQICLKLVKNLGAFGPLRWREHDSISKLQQQGVILGNILSRINKSDEPNIYELEGLPFIHKLWRDITQDETSLCVTADQAACGLDKELRKLHPENSQSLARSLIMQIMDEGCFQKESILTVFQFISFLKPYEMSFSALIDDIADEEEIIKKLSDIDNLSEVLKDLSDFGDLPTKPVFIHLTRLLVNDDFITRESVGQYFEDMVNLKRKQIIQNCLEMLESENALDRQASIILLTLVNSTESLDGIAYLAQTDSDDHVREVARQMLLRQKEGNRMLQQLALSTHGFQGLLAT